MINFFKKNKIIAVTFVSYLLVLIFRQDIFINAIKQTGSFLLEMIEIMPAIMIISALITVWVPSEVISKNFGEKSGFKGKLISIFIGSFSAGPIYAAFPMAKSLYNKGASIANIVVIISSWAVIKIPMLLVETKFLGAPFALTRYLITVPAIIILGYIIGKFVKRKAIDEDEAVTEEKIIQLPNLNCGSCQYKTCEALAAAIKAGNATTDECVINRNKKEKA